MEQFLFDKEFVISEKYVYLPSQIGRFDKLSDRFGKSTNSIADVMELVDMLDLGSSASRRAGSIPVIRTKGKALQK